jgi:hypothetical protein
MLFLVLGLIECECCGCDACQSLCQWHEHDCVYDPDGFCLMCNEQRGVVFG